MSYTLALEFSYFRMWTYLLSTLTMPPTHHYTSRIIFFIPFDHAWSVAVPASCGNRGHVCHPRSIADWVTSWVVLCGAPRTTLSDVDMCDQNFIRFLHTISVSVIACRCGCRRRRRRHRVENVESPHHSLLKNAANSLFLTRRRFSEGCTRFACVEHSSPRNIRRPLRF